MTTMKQCVEHLSNEIGARPAGTDEEQSAAVFIKDTLLENTNMDVDLEEFESSFSGELFKGVEAGIVFLAGMISILFPAATVLSLLLALIGCALFVLDELEVFKISSYFSKQPSQNVIAKHIPASGSETKRRSRKIVVITNYDSEKIRPQVKSGFFKYLGYVKIFELVSVALVFLMLLIKLLTGGNLFFTILTVIGVIGSVLPLLAYLFHTTSHYNDGANNNAASVAVMMDVAKRLSTGVYRSEGDTPVIHGRRAAEVASAIPEDTDVVWEAEPNFDEGASEELYTSEKATKSDSGRVQVESSNEAIHGGNGVNALFGAAGAAKPESKTPAKKAEVPASSVATEVFANVPPQNVEAEKMPISFNVQQPETHAEVPASSGTPDWFSRGKERAKEDRPERPADKGVKRSVYGDALSAANATFSSVSESASKDAPAPKTDLEKQLEAIHSQIEKSGRAAEDKVKKDATAAERVLENEEVARKQDEEKKKLAELQEQEKQATSLAADVEDAEVTLRDTSGDTIAQAPIKVEDVKAEYTADASDGATAQSDNSSVASQIPSLSKAEEPEVHIRETSEVREPLQKLDNIVQKPNIEKEDIDLQPVPRDILESHSATQERLAKRSSGRSPIDERLAAKGSSRTQTLTPRTNSFDEQANATAKRDIQLPSLTGAIKAQKVEDKKNESAEANDDGSKKMNKAASGIMVPSLSSKSDETEKTSDNQIVANAGAFGVGEATGTFAPITDELVAGLSEEETYVLDADDTIFEEHTTESGVVTGPGYVDIPETRTESVFGKIFNRKKKKSEEDTSLSESFGVDDNYDATDLADERGDWSTFAEDDDEWNGGVAYAEGPADEEIGEVYETVEEDSGHARDEVYNFADNDIKTEVWCVALGAQYASHAGLNNFMTKHKDELKGSIFVVLDGLGCGATKLVETQGVIKRHQMTARMKRIARSSAKNVGVELGGENMTWCESLAANIANFGFSTIHLAGYEGDRPALLSTDEDVAENVDETICQENANLVMEIVRSI